MKNKLTPNEQQLQSKLNEAQFSYQEADWKQIESAVAKKGFMANYGTFFKAAAAFVVLAAVVYAVNTRYSTNEVAETEIETSTEVKSSTNERDELLKSKSLTNSSNSEEQTNSNNIPVQEIIASQPLEKKGIESVGNRTKTSKSKSVKTTEVKDVTANASNKSSAKQKAQQESFSADLDFLNIGILSNTCINAPIEFQGEFVSSIEEELKFEWLINGNKIDGNELKNSYTFSDAGLYTLTFVILNEEKTLAKVSKAIEIEPVKTIDFRYEDISNPFYDNNVRLLAINPEPGEYMWYFNKYNDRVQFKKVTAWWFEHPGTYQMNLDYTSKNGCTSTTTKTVTMEKQFTPNSFPNIFSPNDQDGTNDEFILTAFQPYKYTKFLLTISDMNGNVVFRTNDKYEGWNGRINNNSGGILTGYFAWQVQIENNNGRSRTFQGKVQIRNF